jgi:hypothetical protein
VSNIVIYYHDPVEVSPSTSWTGLCSNLRNARRISINATNNARVTELFDYAQPDAVITVDDQPVISIEQTQMNPSGHNIPQRFSFQVRAAEVGVPSILYYPEYSRRTFSDPNVRYAQIRVLLAQRRVMELFSVPALSVFWPTDSQTLLPSTRQNAHQTLATIIETIVSNAGNSKMLLQLPHIVEALSHMERVISKHAKSYQRNSSVRRLLPNGFPSARTRQGISIDPPSAARLLRTEDFLDSLIAHPQTPLWGGIEARLRSRTFTLLFTGTANKSRNDSEHPWPGYLTLLDVLYLRMEKGMSQNERIANLVYRLPVPITTFLSRANQSQPPTPTFIVDTFADLILLDGGIVPGRPMRGSTPASVILR